MLSVSKIVIESTNIHTPFYAKKMLEKIRAIPVFLNWPQSLEPGRCYTHIRYVQYGTRWLFDMV
jgi:hypothetical protein